MKFHIFTNEVAGGWEPSDLALMLGGSEEAVVRLATEFAERGWDVVIYHNGGQKEGTTENGVSYLPREAFNPREARDVLLTLKDNKPHLIQVKADIRLHWSMEVERPWRTSGIDAFICISEYHASRVADWVPKETLRVAPHGVPVPQIVADQADVTRIPGTVLYSSSPDRGLWALLQKWPRLRDQGLTLSTTYGWRLFDACRGQNDPFKRQVERLLSQDGVTVLDTVSQWEMNRLYAASEFWALPLEKPDSELFCLNAIKARIGGATPVVNRIGALRNTVPRWIDWDGFTAGNRDIQEATQGERYDPLEWSTIVDRYWSPLLTGAR